MRSNYKRLGDYIKVVNKRNKKLEVETLLGVSIRKVLMPSIANTIGTNMTTYKIIKRNQFAYGPVTSRNGDKISIAILDEYDEAIVSQAYTVFKIIDENALSPEYLMMWFRRPEFDRYARYKSHGSAREIFGWDEMLETELPIPSIETQQEIVDEYQTITKRIQLNEQLNQKLEETAQALYKHWFVDFEFPIDLCHTERNRSASEDGINNKINYAKGYKSSGGAMFYNEELDGEVPEGWEVEKIEDIANMRYGKMLDSDLFIDEGYPVYSGYGIRGYYKSFMYEFPQILVLCRGVSGTGEVRLSPPFSYITNLSIVVENNSKSVGQEFLFFYLKNDNLRKLDSGSAQSQITINDLGYHKILIPRRDIQELFAEKIKKINSHLSDQMLPKLGELSVLLLSKMATVGSEEVIATQN